MAVSPEQAPDPRDVPDLVGDEARALVGTTLTRRSGMVDERDFQRWAAAVGDRNPLYFDRDHARSLGHRDVVMPPLFIPVVTLGVVDLDVLNADGTPSDDGPGAIPLPACPRRMAGGTRFDFRRTLYPGDVVTEVATVSGIEQKSGRSGAFVLLRVATEYTRDDDVVTTSSTTFIARP